MPQIQLSSTKRKTFPSASSDDPQNADNYYLVLLVSTLFNSSIKHLGKQRFQAMLVGKLFLKLQHTITNRE